MEKLTTSVLVKTSAVAGITNITLQYITSSPMTSYIIGMVFAYIYAMNSKDFEFNLKEDIAITGVGITLIYFLSSFIQKYINTIHMIKDIEATVEVSNILGVIIGSVILIIVKYWFNIKDTVVKNKMDIVIKNKGDNK